MNRQHLFSCSGVTSIPRQNQRGGVGTLLQRVLLESPAGDSAFSAMSVLTLPPGASIGVHVHEHDEEAYVVIAGEGMYTSEEGEHAMTAGDISLCYKGEKHGIVNTGTTDLIMAGIVVQK